MINIYEIDQQNIWTGRTKQIGIKDGAPIGWVRTVPPELKEGEYARFSGKDGWSILNYYPQEISQIDIVPQSVSMRQARLALLDAGLLSRVEDVISQLEEPNRSIAQIEWEYSQTVERYSELVKSLGESLQLNEDEIDNLFKFAYTM